MTSVVRACLALAAALPLAAQAPSLAGRSAVYAPRAMAATSQPLASQAALDVMRTGGNAIDGAIAAAAVLSVVEPHMTGIGGDMFALVWLAKSQRLVALNASGRAGAGMTRAAFETSGLTAIPRDARSITVPGALAGWEMLRRTYGRRSLAQVLAPAIGYARDGFPVSPIIADDWREEVAFLQRDSAAAATFLPGGRAPEAGTWFRNPDYARTLSDIARLGVGHFYGGALGRRMARHVASRGGFLTPADMAANAPAWVTPISVPFRGVRVWQLPPNNQGIAVLEMLRLLEPYDLKALGHNTPAYLHRLIEAKKLAYADLSRFVGDAGHLDGPIERLVSDDFVSARRAVLDTLRAQARVEPGAFRTKSETIYLTVADADGNMVSFINSLYDAFGSGVVVPGTGFALHNRGEGFTLAPDLPNTVAPGKRPFHTLIPGFVTRTEQGREVAHMSFGLMGGGMQAQGHVQLLLNLLEFGMPPQDAVDAARFRHLSGLRVAFEAPIGASTRAALAAMGHTPTDAPRASYGGAQLILRLPKGWVAASDPRKDGAAMGY